LIGLGSEARMNTPSSVGANWLWRTKAGTFNSDLAKKLRHKMKIYSRIQE